MEKIRWGDAILIWVGRVGANFLSISQPLTLSFVNSLIFYYSLRHQFDLKETVFDVKIYNNKAESLY